MISASASLPFVIIFERHWDQEPKKILKGLIPKLSEEGYNTLCFEAPQNLTEKEILFSHLKGLEFDSRLNSQANECVERAGIKDIQLSNLKFKELAELMRLYVSSKRYLEVAQKIKDLPASLLLKDVFKDAKNFYFSIKGIDIDAKDFENMMSQDFVQKMRVIEKNEEYRISTIFENLLRLQKSGKNIVFICGALHAENLINKFKEKNMEDQVLYYFPHSNENYMDSINDVKEFCSNETLKSHTFCVINEQDSNLLKETMIREIKLSNTITKNKC